MRISDWSSDVCSSDLGPSDVFVDDPLVRETLEIEHRLRDNGYSSLPHVPALAGDFEFEGETVEEIVAEARRLLLHQQAVELSGPASWRRSVSWPSRRRRSTRCWRSISTVRRPLRTREIGRAHV